MGMLPTVVATLLADTREYMASMDEAGAKMAEFGGIAETSGGRMNKFANTASTAVLGVGAAITAFGVDKAMQFQEGLDKLQNQAGLTADQADKLGKAIMGISNATGQTTSDLINSALTVEQAGIKGKNATDLLNTAAKAAVVTNASVADTTQAIVAAQTLQIAKGMSVIDLTGKLVAGSRDFVGGLQAEESMLSGRVGVALAAHGVSLSTVTALGAEFAKVGLPSRSIASFASALTNIQNPTKTYTTNLEKARLSQNILAADLRRGDIGGMLKYIKEQAGGSAAKLQEMVNAVFGKTGGAAASDLINNLESFVTIQKQVAGAGSGSLNTGFSEATKQFGVQMKIIETNLVNSATALGLKLMPYFKDAANIIIGSMNYFSKHPLVTKIASDATLALFGASLAYKVTQAIGKIPGLGTLLGKIPGLGSLFKSTDTELLTQIAANTAASATEGAIADAELAKSGTGGGLLGFAKGLGLGALDFVAEVAGPLAIVGLGIKSLTDQWKNTHRGQTLSGPQLPNNAATNALGGVVTTQNTSLNGESLVGPIFQVLAKQLDEVNTLYYQHKLTIAQANKALLNFSKQDQKRNYSLKVRITG